MRIAIVHDWLNGMRGGEKVLEIICKMLPEANIFTLVCEQDKISPLLRSRQITTSFIQALPGSPRHYRAYLALFPSAIEHLDLREYDLIISTSHCVAKGAVPGPYGQHLCYCFTPMRYIWDGYWEYFRPGVGAGLRRLLAPLVASRLRMWDTASCARVDRFVAISRHVAARIKRYYDRDCGIIYPPVDTDRFNLAGEDRDLFLLCVSALVPYKRLDLAVQFSKGQRIPIQIVGTGPEEKRLKLLAKGAPVSFLGHVSEDRLRELYRGCAALLMPGEEDFGIAPVEAQACGAPVIALAKGGALETVVEAQSGVLFQEPSLSSLNKAWDRFKEIDFDSETVRNSALRFSVDRFTAAFQAEVAALSAS